MRQVRSIAWAMLLTAAAALAQADSGATAACLGCHDFGPESPVHAVQAGSHGSSDDPAGVSGCQACHGASAAHTRAPIVVSPATSFGPRWTSSSFHQDAPCLRCHASDQAAHWQDALHMLNNLTCVTCHDVHAERDKVLFPEEQSAVCTTCHKTQKKGIHGLEDMTGSNPPCSSCHNPHDHESAKTQMLNNGSEGCRSCHNLERMDRSPKIHDKVKGYHRRMLQADHTCLDCHQGVAHAAADAVTAIVPTAVNSSDITLFYPGMADSDWLLQGHPGSQPLRQGKNCLQCHRGEEASMGAAQAVGFEPAAREITVAFGGDTAQWTISLSWNGPESDSAISLMWGDGGSEVFRRGGCFAACHSDMPGMSRDRGQKTSKYLQASRLQQPQLGQPAIIRPNSELAALMAAGDFVELWRVQLASGEIEIAALLADVVWQKTDLIQINKTYNEGRWTVALTVPLNNTVSYKSFTLDEKYTVGVALHGADNSGGKHWVSLPLTVSFTGDETNFRVAQQEQQ